MIIFVVELKKGHFYPKKELSTLLPLGNERQKVFQKEKSPNVMA